MNVTPTPTEPHQDVRERVRAVLVDAARHESFEGTDIDHLTDAVLAAVSAATPDKREALSGEGLPERFRFSRTVYGDVADDATRVLLALTDGGHADQPSDYLRWVSIRAAQALAARPAPAVNAADPDERERAQRYTTVLAHLNREQARAEAAEAEVDALRARIEVLAREYADAIPGFVRRLRAALAARPARGERATDPLIVSAIRRHPSGTLRYEPASGPATGTSGRSFLAEYDAALAARPAPAVNAADVRAGVLAACWPNGDALDGISARTADLITASVMRHLGLTVADEPTLTDKEA